MSDFLQPHGLQHHRLPCPSPSPGACSNSCPLGQWCHPTILSSVVPFSSSLQSFPASGSFPMSWLFPIRWPKYWNFSFSISPSSEYSGLTFFRIDWFDLLAVQGTLKSLLQHHSSKVSVLQCSAFRRWFIFTKGAVAKWMRNLSQFILPGGHGVLLLSTMSIHFPLSQKSLCGPDL